MTTPEETLLSMQSIEPALESRFRPAPVVDPDNPPWGIPLALTAWILSVALGWIVPQLCALPYVASRYRGVDATRGVLLSDKTFILILVCGFIPAHLLTLLVAWIVAGRLGKFSPARTLGLSWPSGFGVWKSTGLAIFLFAISFLILLRFGGQDTELERLLQSSRAAALVTAFIAVATAPLVEEVIYRGLLYSALQRTAGPVVAVIVVSCLFAGLHVPQYWPNLAAISSIALLSVVLTVTRARTGRLLPCYVIHLVFNGIQSAIIFGEPYLRAFAERWQQHAPGVTSLIFLFHR